MALEYFAEADLRALPDMDDAVTYTDARIQAAHDYIAGILEREVGTSFVARVVADEVRDGGDGRRYAVSVSAPYVLSSPAPTATENGVAVTDTIIVRGGGLLYKFSAGGATPNAWQPGLSNLVIDYSAGYSAAPPGDVKEAVLKGVRDHLLATNSNAAVDERWTTISSEHGTIERGGPGSANPTGYPVVDEMIVAWRDRIDVLGFA